jgi:hypothetical protein
MHLELSDDETAAFLKELDDVVQNARFFLSPRIQTLKAIREKIRPEPVREPLPPRKHHQPPRFIGGLRARQ